MATRAELITGLEYLIQEARRIAASLRPEEWQVAVDQDGWRATEVLAHVAGVGTIIVPFVTAMMSAPARTDAVAGTNIDQLNAGLVAARAGKTPAELAEEVAMAYAGVAEWVREAPDDLLQKHVTAGGHRDIPLSDMLIRMTILHGLGHIYSAYSAVFFANAPQ